MSGRLRKSAVVLWVVGPVLLALSLFRPGGTLPTGSGAHGIGLEQRGCNDTQGEKSDAIHEVGASAIMVSRGWPVKARSRRHLTVVRWNRSPTSAQARRPCGSSLQHRVS